MSSYIPGFTVKEIRLRKHWQQAMLLYYNGHYTNANLSLVESGIQKPYNDTLYKLIGDMGVSPPTIFYPWLEDQTMDVFLKRDRIIQLLDDTSPLSCQKVMLLVKELQHKMGFENGINLQFILSCKAQLNELMQDDANKTVSLVNNGMALTYEEFNEDTFDGSMLIFEESTLLHTLAYAYNRMGRQDDAIKLLYRIQDGIIRLPEDDHEKEKKLAKVLLTLSDFLIQAERYEEALQICELGNIVSIKRNKGKYTPHFLYNKAQILFIASPQKYKRHLQKECRILLQLAYFGFILLRKIERAKLVLKDARQRFGIQFNTYETENLTYVDFDHTIMRGEPIKCDEIGTLIATLRYNAGMTQRELSEGICTQGNLAKIESNKWRKKKRKKDDVINTQDDSTKVDVIQIDINAYHAEAIMQRLGRDVNQYFHTFLSKEEFDNKQMRDEINSRLVSLDFDGAEELLQTLKTKESYEKGVNLQFVKYAEAEIFRSRNGSEHPKYFDMVMDAIKITKFKFDENKIDNYHLTYYEILLINGMGLHYCESGDLRRGLRLFERLIDNVNNNYVDEFEKIRTYTTVLYNYSKYLGRAKRHEDALEIVNEGELLCLKHGRLTRLHNFAANHGFNLLKLGKKEESIPHIALAYYGSIIFGEIDNQQATAIFAKEHLGIEFD